MYEDKLCYAGQLFWHATEPFRNLLYIKHATNTNEQVA